MWLAGCNNADVSISGLGKSSGGYTMVVNSPLSSQQVINSPSGVYVIKVQSSTVSMVAAQTAGGYTMNVGAVFQ